FFVVRSISFFFFQAEDGIRDRNVTGVQTCALPIWPVWHERNRSTPTPWNSWPTGRASLQLDGLLGVVGPSIRVVQGSRSQPCDIRHFAPFSFRAVAIHVSIQPHW